MSFFNLIIPFDHQPIYTFLVLDYQIVEPYKDYIGSYQNLDSYRSLESYLNKPQNNYLIKRIDLNDSNLQIVVVEREYSNLKSLKNSVIELVQQIFFIQIERPLRPASNEPVEDENDKLVCSNQFEPLQSTLNRNSADKSYLFYKMDRNLIDEFIKYTNKTMLLFLNDNLKALKHVIKKQKILNQFTNLPIILQKCNSRSNFKSESIWLSSELRKQVISYLALIRYYYYLWTTFDLFEKELAIITMNEFQMLNIELLRLIPNKRLSFNEEVKIIRFVRDKNEPTEFWPIKTVLDAFREQYYEMKEKN